MHDAVAHERIQVRAYYLWIERGRPIGTPDADWYRAKQEFAQEPVEDASALVAAAKTIGTAMGTVASAVGSLGRGRHRNQKRPRW